VLVGERARRDTAGARLKETVEQIQEHGCQVKDLDTGLLDFPSLYRGEVVLLCWKLGKTGSASGTAWMRASAGASPSTSIFLKNHKGDFAQ